MDQYTDKPFRQSTRALWSKIVPRDQLRANNVDGANKIQHFIREEAQTQRATNLQLMVTHKTTTNKKRLLYCRVL